MARWVVYPRKATAGCPARWTKRGTGVVVIGRSALSRDLRCDATCRVIQGSYRLSSGVCLGGQAARGIIRKRRSPPGEVDFFHPVAATVVSSCVLFGRSIEDSACQPIV